MADRATPATDFEICGVPMSVLADTAKNIHAAMLAEEIAKPFPAYHPARLFSWRFLIDGALASPEEAVAWLESHPGVLPPPMTFVCGGAWHFSGGHGGPRPFVRRFMEGICNLHIDLYTFTAGGSRLEMTTDAEMPHVEGDGC